jgi:chorismate mutase
MDELGRLRKKVDKIDDKILNSLSERVEICKAIGGIKKTKGLQIRDTSRENEVYKRVKAKAAESNLDLEQVEAIFREIVNMCSAVQE